MQHIIINSAALAVLHSWVTPGHVLGAVEEIEPGAYMIELDDETFARLFAESSDGRESPSDVILRLDAKSRGRVN